MLSSIAGRHTSHSLATKLRRFDSGFHISVQPVQPSQPLVLQWYTHAASLTEEALRDVRILSPGGDACCPGSVCSRPESRESWRSMCHMYAVLRPRLGPGRCLNWSFSEHLRASQSISEHLRASQIWNVFCAIQELPEQVRNALRFLRGLSALPHSIGTRPQGLEVCSHRLAPVLLLRPFLPATWPEAKPTLVLDLDETLVVPSAMLQESDEAKQVLSL